MIRVIFVTLMVKGLVLGVLWGAFGLGQILEPGFLGSAGNPIGDRLLGILDLFVGAILAVMCFLCLFVLDGGAWYKKNWHQYQKEGDPHV